jgi:xanthine dehydrogenase FAD-binding subunit
VYEGIRSPAIHTPRSVSEFISTASHYPHAVIWAGGTYIMGRPNYYPSDGLTDIIYLGEIADLKKITRNDRFIEIGSMVTASQLLNAGKLVLSDVLLDTLSKVGSKIVRKQITIGGALCTPDIRLVLPGSLAILDAIVEVKQIQGNKTINRWIPVSRLYDKDGQLLLTGMNLITRVRIGLETGNFQRFMMVDSPVHDPKRCVIFAFQCTKGQSNMSKAHFCFTFPTAGFHISRELETQLSGQPLPVPPQRINRLSFALTSEIHKMHPQVTDLQLERCRRMFEAVFHELNTEVLEE